VNLRRSQPISAPWAGGGSPEDRREQDVHHQGTAAGDHADGGRDTLERTYRHLIVVHWLAGGSSSFWNQAR
jgi:hypothetical protein